MTPPNCTTLLPPPVPSKNRRPHVPHQHLAATEHASSTHQDSSTPPHERWHSFPRAPTGFPTTLRSSPKRGATCHLSTWYRQRRLAVSAGETEMRVGGAQVPCRVMCSTDGGTRLKCGSVGQISLALRQFNKGGGGEEGGPPSPIEPPKLIGGRGVSAERAPRRRLDHGAQGRQSVRGVRISRVRWMGGLTPSYAHNHNRQPRAPPCTLAHPRPPRAPPTPGPSRQADRDRVVQDPRPDHHAGRAHQGRD